MPQLTLKLSKNIDITQISFKELFVLIHAALEDVPNMNIATCHSGVIQEEYSYIGYGDERYTKAYLEFMWLENNERLAVIDQIGQKLLRVLEEILVPQIEKQNLFCIPRVRIANLGEVGKSYFISKGRAS